MSGDNWIVLVTLVAYKLVLIGVGVWASSRNRTEGDFLLASQGLGAWVAGLSYAASTSSAWVLLGFSGFVYANGLSALWMVPGIWGGYLAVWLFFGKRLRAETHTQGHVTPTDFIIAGLGPQSRRIIAAIASAFILFCFIFYIAAQFGAAAAAFETQFGLGITESVLIGAAVVLVYAVLGVWGVGVNAMGQPQLTARLMAVKDEAARMRGFTIAMAWAVLVFTGMTVLALAGRALVGGASDGETLFYTLSNDLFPPVLAGLVIAAVLSAVMSTVDSILLSASAAVSHDLGVSKRFKGREVLVSRIVMVSIAGLAVWMTLSVPSTIFARVLFAWSAIGAAFGPIIAMRVLGFEPKGWAVGTAMCLGFGLTVLFNFLGSLPLDPEGSNILIRWAHAPGDPFERLVPWIPALFVLWLGGRGR